jgi:Cof subfamily protein (haloacid dehalogenase superfamily)
VLPAVGHRGPGADEVVELPSPLGFRPRLVATDLDGTLLTSTGEVTPRSRAALEACWGAGIPVVGVTGRGPRLLDSVREALDGRGIAVLAQGGYVVDLERDEVLRTIGLPRAQATDVIERIETVAGELIVAVEDAAEQAEARGPLRVQHGFNWPYPEPAHLLPRNKVLPSGAVLKVFLRSSTIDQDELLALARQVVDPVEAEVTHAGLGFIEVLPPGITKATGLAIALERYGVGFGDVLAFGDMPNDVPMLTAVAKAGGRSVAVANAHPAVRAVAAQLTSGHDVDGVAQYLEAVLAGE